MVNIPGGCGIDVPGGSTVVASVDEATLPAGVGVLENPITYDVPATKHMVGDISFTVVYVDAGDPGTPDDDTSGVTLPNTGSGSGRAAGTAAIVAAAIAASGALAGLGAHARTMRTPRR